MMSHINAASSLRGMTNSSCSVVVCLFEYNLPCISLLCPCYIESRKYSSFKI